MTRDDAGRRPDSFRPVESLIQTTLHARHQRKRAGVLEGGAGSPLHVWRREKK